MNWETYVFVDTLALPDAVEPYPENIEVRKCGGDDAGYESRAEVHSGGVDGGIARARDLYPNYVILSDMVPHAGEAGRDVLPDTLGEMPQSPIRDFSNSILSSRTPMI